jgi:hypothetical protein
MQKPQQLHYIYLESTEPFHLCPLQSANGRRGTNNTLSHLCPIKLENGRRGTTATERSIKELYGTKKTS